MYIYVVSDPANMEENRYAVGTAEETPETILSHYSTRLTNPVLVMYWLCSDCELVMQKINLALYHHKVEREWFHIDKETLISTLLSFLVTCDLPV